MKAYHNTAGLKFDDPTTGNAASGALITVRINSTQSVASIFDVDDVAIGNPLTADSNGNYAFKAADNIYDIIISEGTANEEKLIKVEIAEIPAAPIIINDLSQSYWFDTYALMRDSAILFPDNKTIKTREYESGMGGGAEYNKITGTGTANGYKITASTLTNSSFVLNVTYTTAVRQWGANSSGSIAFITGAIQAALDSEASVITFNGEDSPTIDPIYVRQSYKRLELNGWSPKSASTVGLTTWALINVLKTDSPDGYDRPEQWQPIVRVVIDGGIIDYNESPDIATTNFHMVQVNLGVSCEVNNMQLSNNFISIADTTKGSAVIFRGECRNCSCDNNDISSIRGHGFGHTNRYITGNFTEAAGEFGTDTYTLNSEIDGLLRPQNTLYTNNILNGVWGYAFDVHSFNGISTITDNNRVVDCGSFFKNQTGRTYATGNYIKNLKTFIDASMPQNTFWTGWLSGFSNGIVYPEGTSIIEGNTFINCPREFIINHPTQQGGNDWISEDGFILAGRRGAFTQSQASTSSIINDKFKETWSGGIYLEEIPTSPESNGQIEISHNKFRIFNTQIGGAQARIINANGTEGLNVADNIYTEQNAVTTAFLVFCIIENIDNCRISHNTVIKAAGQSCALAWNADAVCTKNIATENIGIGCTIDGVFDVNANNLLV